MLNPLKARDLERLYKACDNSWQVLSPFRQGRREKIEAYCGSEYGESDEKATYVNDLLSTAVAYMVQLVANNPRCLVTTHEQALRSFAKKFAAEVNHHVVEMNLRTQLQRCVLNAFFGMGIMKTCRTQSGYMVEIPNPELQYGHPASENVPWNILVDPGEVLAESISLDDFCYDTRASVWEKIEFAYHRYRVPLEDVKNDERFDPQVVAKLVATSKFEPPEFGGDDRPTSDLSRGCYEDPDELVPMVTLRDTWLPKENRWGVFVDSHDPMKPLYYEPWDGPEAGPYRILNLLAEVPDNIMSLSPAANIFHLHRLRNSLHRKMARQAQNQKTLYGYRGDEQEAVNVRDAKDQDLIRMLDPANVATLKYGGPDQAILAYLAILEGTSSREAGNLDLMRGLGPQSGTARQDEMIGARGDATMNKMRSNVLEFTAGIMSDIGHYDWVDAFRELQTTRTEPGISLPIPVHWTAEEREGDIWQYSFHVIPHSLEFRTPRDMGQELLGLIQNIYVPMTPHLQAAGQMIDMRALTDNIAELFELPQLRELIVDTGMSPEEMSGMLTQGGGGHGAQPGGPREYIRRSVPQSANPASQRVMQAQSLLSAAGAES